jgi:addiction module RelE/StbE family toxin
LSRAELELRWRPMALVDREAILEYIAQDNVTAAIELDEEFEAKAEIARQRPTLYKTGRVKGTRELVVRPNYVMVYRVLPDAVEFLRVLHAAQQWPAVEVSLGYERDDGPLTKRQLAEVRKAAKRDLPTGKLLSRKKLL